MEFKDNYNIFKIHPDSVIDLLEGFGNTCDDVDGSLLQLIKSNVHQHTSPKRLHLNSYIYIQLHSGYDYYGSNSGYQSEYQISMFDGMPEFYAKQVYDTLTELGIKFKLNGLTKGQIISNKIKENK